MAKEQNLSLNSTKISGTCGRLMCCLRYESEVYEEELKRTPKIDSIVDTPDGEGIVSEINPLAGIVRVRMNANPDQAPKAFSRDVVKVKGYLRKKEKEEKIDEDLKKLEE
jgi:cell fate regulator YaaT (PSP1 superfamily)